MTEPTANTPSIPDQIANVATNDNVNNIAPKIIIDSTTDDSTNIVKSNSSTLNSNETSTITTSKSSPVMAPTSDADLPMFRSLSNPSLVENSRPTNQPSADGSGYIAGAFESLDNVFRFTKQLVLEKMGKATISTDPEIQNKLEYLQEVKAQYEELTRLGNKYIEQFSAITETMDELGLRMISMAVKEKDSHYLKKVGESYRNISKNNESYVTSIQTFYSSVEHFKDKALEDTLETAKKFEQVRFEYDIALEKYQKLENTSTSKTVVAKQEMDRIHEKYTQMRNALIIKIETLNYKRKGDMEFQMSAYLRNLVSYYSNSLYLVNKVAAPVSQSQSRENLESQVENKAEKVENQVEKVQEKVEENGKEEVKDELVVNENKQ